MNTIPLEDSEELVELCEEHGLDHDAVIVYCDNLHISAHEFADNINNYVNAYQGYWDNFVDFATQLFDDTQDVPEHLASYIDYEAFARDLLMGGDYWEHQGYVFSNY